MDTFTFTTNVSMFLLANHSSVSIAHKTCGHDVILSRVIRRIRRLVEACIVYRWRAAEQSMDFVRGPVDSIAQSENFPVNGFRLMVALAGCSLVAPLIHLMRGESSRMMDTLHSELFRNGMATNFLVTTIFVH